jgi:hypothetical protein
LLLLSSGVSEPLAALTRTGSVPLCYSCLLVFNADFNLVQGPAQTRLKRPGHPVNAAQVVQNLTVQVRGQAK